MLNPSNQITAQTHQLVIIDSQVNNYQSLVSDVGNDTTVLVLDSSSDGLAQISDLLVPNLKVDDMDSSHTVAQNRADIFNGIMRSPT